MIKVLDPGLKSPEHIIVPGVRNNVLTLWKHHLGLGL